MYMRVKQCWRGQEQRRLRGSTMDTASSILVQCGGGMNGDLPFCNANRLVLGEGVVLSESPRGNGLFLVGGDV